MNPLKSKLFCILLVTPIFLFDPFNKIAAAESDSLKFIGHSFVQIKTSDGKNIYIDPYGVNAFKDSADVVLITHEHGDHNDLSRVKQKKNCVVIRVANAIKSGVYQNFIVGNISIKAVAAYNSNHPKGSSVGYIVEFNSIKLYHAGDTGEITEMAELEKENLSYALLPMDGVYTMSPEQATHAASVIKAKYDIPIHTMPPTDTYSDAIVARFTSPNKLIVKHGKTIALSNITSVEKVGTLPSSIRLLQNYPNPFNPETIIKYQLDANSFVELKVYDLLGKDVQTLVYENKNSGSYEVNFDASGLSSGIYFYSLKAGGFLQIRKMLFIK